MSNNNRLDKIERAMRGPGHHQVVVVHELDPDREVKIDQARQPLGYADKLTVVVTRGGYRASRYQGGSNEKA